MSSAELARTSGIDPSALSKIENGKRGVTRNFAPSLAKALQVPVNELYANMGSPIPAAAVEPVATLGSLRIAHDAPDPSTFYGAVRDVPVMGTAQAGPTGAFVINSLGGPIGWAQRFAGIIGMSGVFAIYVEGESMLPWRKPGSLVYVHETRPPAPGCHVVVEIEGAVGEPPLCLIKELVRRSPTKLELRQHNPPGTIEIEQASVRRILRVLEWEEVTGAG